MLHCIDSAAVASLHRYSGLFGMVTEAAFRDTNDKMMYLCASL